MQTIYYTIYRHNLHLHVTVYTPVGFLLTGLPLLPQRVNLLSLLLTVSLQPS